MGAKTTADPDDRAARDAWVSAGVKAGLALLAPADVERFAQLGAFPLADPVPIRVLTLLWGRAGMDEAAVRGACARLAAVGLVEVERRGAGEVVEIGRASC